jgi:hypothetical protein
LPTEHLLGLLSVTNYWYIVALNSGGARAAPSWRSRGLLAVNGADLDPDGKVRGLLRDAKGSFTTFFAPQVVSQTAALDINDRRQIVGIFR